MKDKEQVQKRIIALLQENSILQVACYKAGISRATFYRWQNEDPDFKKMCARSATIGLAILNDGVESVLIKKAREGDMKAIIYWLNNNHKKYKDAYQEYNNKKYDLLQKLEGKQNEADENLEKTREGLRKVIEFMKEAGMDDADVDVKKDDSQESTSEKK